MEFATDKKTFLTELQKVCPIADRKNPMPILSNVLITTAGQQIRLSATNLYLAVSTLFSAVVKSPGHVTVPADSLLDIIKNLPDSAKIALSLNEKSRVLHIQTTRIKLELNTLPGDEFPPLPSPAKTQVGELSISEVSKLIGLTHYAVSQDDSKAHLTNLLLESDGKTILAVGCDSRRLAKAQYKAGKKEKPIKFELCIPLPGVLELKRLIDNIPTEKEPKLQISTEGQNAFFRHSSLLFSIRLSTEQFPGYSKIIPSSYNKIKMDRASFADALRRINLFSGEGSNLVQLSITSDTLTITSASMIGKGVEKIKIEYKGEPINVSFNAAYLLDMLKALTPKEITFGLNGNDKPAVIVSPGYIGIVMPLTQ